VSLEGALQVRLHLEARHIRQAEIVSTRPDVAQRLLQGRRRADVQAAVPLLFSICGRSQATCAALACAAAAGEPGSTLAMAHARRSVAAEMLREVAWLSLLQWPQRLGETPSAEAVAAARLSLTMPLSAPDASRAIAMAAFGMPADEWLVMEEVADLQAWAKAGRTATARFIAQALQAAADTKTTLARHALLPAQLDDRAAASLARALDEDPEFARQPHWQGAAAETGALARHQHQPLLRALMAHDTTRTTARLVARLREMALLLLDKHTVSLGALPRPAGSAVAWVENARGLLLHQVQLDDRGQQVLSYRIVAPTEWNFRPDGPLALALRDAPVADPSAAQALATRLVHSLDPCVACHVEIAHA
jgi:hypothetical protein